GDELSGVQGDGGAGREGVPAFGVAQASPRAHETSAHPTPRRRRSGVGAAAFTLRVKPSPPRAGSVCSRRPSSPRWEGGVDAHASAAGPVRSMFRRDTLAETRRRRAKNQTIGTGIDSLFYLWVSASATVCLHVTSQCANRSNNSPILRSGHPRARKCSSSGGGTGGSSAFPTASP